MTANISYLTLSAAPAITKAFARFAGRGGIDDTALCGFMDRARGGVVGADPGGGMIKQRIGPQGWRAIRRVSHDRAVSPGRADVFRLRVRQELQGEPVPGRVSCARAGLAAVLGSAEASQI